MTTTTALQRSYLFVPGNRPERFAKACATAAHAVIVDLEDAVPAAEKNAARAATKAWLSAEHPVFVRINAAGTEWFDDDLTLCALPGVAGIILPKAEQPEQIAQVAQAGATAILPLIESALGFHQAEMLSRCPQVLRLVFGTIDFRLDLGIDGERDELLYFRSRLVLISKLAGLQPPVDGVTLTINDPVQIDDDTRHGRRIGFGAKLCIHPQQVAAVNAAFLPSAAELAWAQRVVAAANASHGAAAALDGKMIDRPVILQARQTIADAESGTAAS